MTPLHHLQRNIAMTKTDRQPQSHAQFGHPRSQTSRKVDNKQGFEEVALICIPTTHNFLTQGDSNLTHTFNNASINCTSHKILEWGLPTRWSSKKWGRIHVDKFRYLDLGFGGEHAGVSGRATIDHMQGIQFEKKVHPQPKNNKNPEIDPTHMLSVALNSSGSRSWTFATRLLCSAL